MSQVKSARTRTYRPGALEALVLIALVLVFTQQWIVGALGTPELQAAATVFVSIVFQALPFLVLGVALSAAITAFVPESFWSKALPKNKAASIPVACAAGLVLPGCECASVPVSGSLIARGVTPAAALAFLLSAPAINPIVIASTFVAFQGQLHMAFARLIASFTVALIVGLLWLRFGKSEWIRIPRRHDHEDQGKFTVFRRTAAHDFLHAGGFLIVGGLAAAVMNVFLPTQWLDALSENPWVGVIVLAVLAVVLSICSEADAFVAASFTTFSPTAQLAFMVVGPMIDLKLFAMQIGIFGRAFAVRFAPTTFVVAVLISVIVGWVMLR